MISSEDWRDEFLRNFMSGSTVNVEAAYTLKNRVLPQRLFKFFPPTPRAFAGLADRVLWLASPSTFNDPFDCSFAMDGAALLRELGWRLTRDAPGLEGLGQAVVAPIAAELGGVAGRLLTMGFARYPWVAGLLLIQLAKDMPDLLRTRMNARITVPLRKFFQESLKISCFTETSTAPLLWAHYADSHKGFCLEFAVQDFLPEQRHSIFPVHYAPTRMDLTPVLRRLARGSSKTPADSFVVALFKSQDWSYEREWRLIHSDETPSPGVQVSSPRPVTVFAGARMSPDKRDELARVCVAAGIEISDAVLSEDGYGVEFRPPSR